VRSALVAAKLIIRAKLNQNLKNSFLLPALIAGLGLMLAGDATAQIFTTLHSFAPIQFFGFDARSNSDGYTPLGGLVLSGNTLYGTANQGTINRNGTVFAVNTDGAGFTNLYNFSQGNDNTYAFATKVTNSDGAFPYGSLILSSNTLYGTAFTGGSSAMGTLFAIHTDGMGFTNLHTFSGADGETPIAALVLSSNVLYGTTEFGGISNAGTIFAINTDGTDFTNLYDFTGGNDGSNPGCTLILSGSTFYGCTPGGGSFSNGTVFALNIDGMGFTNLYNFTGGNDGYTPVAKLILSGNRLYGTAQGGVGTIGPFGESTPIGAGTVFALNTDGSGFTNLVSFGGGYYGSGSPFSAVILFGSTLLGTVPYGQGDTGVSDDPIYTDTAVGGRIFSINTNGTGYTDLYNFPPIFYQGNGSASDLILSNYTFYGTTDLDGNMATEGGESLGDGSVYSFSFLPKLAIRTSGMNIILTWPTNVSVMDTSGFALQSTTNLASPSWSAVSPSPIVVNGLETVTNAISGTQMFYRLMQ